MILYSTKEIDEALVLKREFYYCLQASYTHTTGFDADAFLILAEDVNKQFPDNTRESFSPLNGFHMGCYKLPRWCSCTVMPPGVSDICHNSVYQCKGNKNCISTSNWPIATTSLHINFRNVKMCIICTS